MNAGDIIFLGSRDVRNLLSVEDCIPAVEEAFRLHGEGKAQAPGVLGIHIDGGGFHIKAGLLDLRMRYFAAKVNGNFPGNPSRFDLPTIQGVIVLCDAEKGTPLAVMDSRDVTSLRTAAATAVAARYLARPTSQTITICGCGEQGRHQVRALAHIFHLRNIFVFDTSAERATRFAEELSAELQLAIMPVSELRPAIAQSDICVTCTPSQHPVLCADDVPEGTFVAAVGADNSYKNEIHPALMSKAKVVCDVLEQCAVMGDLYHALESGAISRSVFTDLGSIVAGKAGRESDKNRCSTARKALQGCGGRRCCI
jgi:ornithine cyclodeaminase/alanine dehydrogenase